MKEDNRPLPYSLRLEPETRAKLEAVAKANGRSLNAQIIMILESALEHENVNFLGVKHPQLSDTESIMRRIAQEVVKEAFTKAGIKLAES